MPRVTRTITHSAQTTPIQVVQRLEEFREKLAANIESQGASLVGVEPSGGMFAHSTVQEVLEDLVLGVGSPALLWAVGTPWADIEARLAAMSGMAIILVEADRVLGHREMTTSVISGDGSTDLSKAVFVGVTEGDPSGPYPAPVEVWFDLTFTFGPGGVLRSKNILWRHADNCSGPAMEYIDWELDGGGVSPQPTVGGARIVRIGGAGESRIVLRNGATLDGTAYGPTDALIGVTPNLAFDPGVNVTMTGGSRLTARTFRSGPFAGPSVNTFNLDSSAILDVGFVSGIGFSIVTNYLDTAPRMSLPVNAGDWGGNPATLEAAINRIAAAVAAALGGPIP